SLLPSGNTSFIAGSGVTLSQSGNTARYSQLTCPQWHIGQTGKMLARESSANRISQQVSLSANFLKHLQYVTSLNRPVTGADIVTTPTGSYPGISAYTGGCLLPDGRIFCAPNGASSIRIYDPKSDSVYVPSAACTGQRGAVLMADGRVFGIGGVSVSIIYNPSTDTLTTPGGESGLLGGCLLPDGRVFCAPWNITTPRIYDPVQNIFTTPNGQYNGVFGGAVLMKDGKVYVVPRSNTSARIYNPFTDITTTPNGTFPGGSNNYQSGTLLPDGRVFCNKFTGSAASVIYNPTTDTLSTPGGSSSSLSIAGNFTSSTLLPDGRVFGAPYTSTAFALLYDPTTDSYSTVTGYPSGLGQYDGAVLMQDGRVFCVPYYATTSRIHKIAININFSLAALTSPPLNKY
ncbi:MAG: hypothetical protein EBU90_27520, partial [Proteobacteria bacterium]|nr:hypothetical protein [Pseudomonadota bacterium]